MFLVPLQGRQGVFGSCGALCVEQMALADPLGVVEVIGVLSVLPALFSPHCLFPA